MLLSVYIQSTVLLSVLRQYLRILFFLGYGFQFVKVLKCEKVSCEHFHFDAIRCLQDAEVLLQLTEEVNATLRNKVSAFFPSLLFLFLEAAEMHL